MARPKTSPSATVLPPRLAAGIEALSGISMDEVRVQRNSSGSARLSALAFAQGADIHVVPGQEQHLPHEAWHVVQQKQGRVAATVRIAGGVRIGEDAGLEAEADRMGKAAMAQAMPGKADARRAAILDRLADHVLAEGLAASSLRPLAKAAGVSDRMLLYYFRDKAEVMAAALAKVSERMVALLAARTAAAPLPLEPLRAQLLGVLLADELWPYMRLWLELASLAAGGDAAYRAVGERLGRGFLAWGAAQLDSATPAQREIDAATLLVTVEGAVLLKSLGLDDVRRAAFPS